MGRQDDPEENIETTESQEVRVVGCWTKRLVAGLAVSIRGPTQGGWAQLSLGFPEAGADVCHLPTLIIPLLLSLGRC